MGAQDATAKPTIVSATWRDGYGRTYEVVDRQLLDDARAALDAAVREERSIRVQALA